ncbi:hypothetical protein CDD82_501 [Ophiocordyceps australis]|uniref:O-methyltransferase C-terminal domain-containing protein n=1 Tax=Ophiocordyceps australis TaxID=1399860 RepID=A0A2C5YLM9_9HYPO|nr:hypothetical protein CDD82_501 [Ophiocordyceps australis]
MQDSSSLASGHTTPQQQGSIKSTLNAASPMSPVSSVSPPALGNKMPAPLLTAARPGPRSLSHYPPLGHIALAMAKFKMPSWLYSTTNMPDAKKHHRRSFAGFSTPKAKHKPMSKQSDMTVVKSNVSSEPSQLSPPPPPSPPGAVSPMRHLATKIGLEADVLDEYITTNNLPEPGLDAKAPAEFPNLPFQMQTRRQELIVALTQLLALLRGPRESIRLGAWGALDVAGLQLINNYGIAQLVPLDSPIALTELQAQSGMNPVTLARVLRFVMTNHIFHEPAPGFIAHTAASRVLAQDAALRDWVGFNTEEVFPASAHVLDALKKDAEATSLTATGFNVAFGTFGTKSIFDTLGDDPQRAKRMVGTMSSMTCSQGYETHYFVESVDLAKENELEGTLVDVGGSHGLVCVELAQRWDKMKFVVQDLDKTVKSTPQPICDDPAVAQRIQMQVHDFFQEQPVKNADVYLFRWIIHNYSTPYAVKLLRNLIPALKPGARIIINEHCIRTAGGETPWDERLMRSMDMVMMALLNAEEREEKEFRALFEQADARFTFKVKLLPVCLPRCL